MKYDIYNFDKRISNHENNIRNSSMPEGSKKLIFDFKRNCVIEGLSMARVDKYMQTLKVLGEMLPKAFGEADKTDLTDPVFKIEKNPAWSSWTKHDYKVSLKKFYKWLGKKELIEWIKAGRNHSVKLPEELLTKADIDALINAAHAVDFKALVSCLWEGGCRIGELLSLQVKNCVFDSMGVKLIVDGKTGMRRIRLISSAPFLKECIKGRSPDERVWASDYGAVIMRLKRLAEKANVNKKIYPHLFRHSRATFLATYLTEAQLNIYFGWVQGSGMPRIYVHLNGDDLDNTLLKIPGAKENNVLVSPETPILHRNDLPMELLTPPSKILGDMSRSILTLLRDQPGLTRSQISKNLKYSESVRSKVPKILKWGYIQKDDSKRYSLTPRGIAALEKITGVTVSPIEEATVNLIRGVPEIPKETVTEIPTMTNTTETVTEITSGARRLKKMISGFTVELYEFVKNNDGMTATAMSRHFGKKNDFIRPYLHRLKDYGYLINDSGKWYVSTIEKSKQNIEAANDLHPIKQSQSFDFSVLSNESKAAAL